MLIDKPYLINLPQIKDRISFFYVEYAKIVREEGSLYAVFESSYVQIPTAQVAVLMLGPATSVTNAAMESLASHGAMVMWVGASGEALHSSSTTLTSSSGLAERQASLFADQKRRVAAARRLYRLRFPDDMDTDKLYVRQLLGREGQHMKEVYRTYAERAGVPWTRRVARNPEDRINRLITRGNAILYGMARIHIHALGLSPALGFLHKGNSESFTMDIADIYKHETTIPTAFFIASACLSPESEAKMYRTQLRAKFKELQIMKRIPLDIGTVLDVDNHARINTLMGTRITVIDGRYWVQ